MTVFTTAEVRKIIDGYNRDEYSYGKMVELFDEKAKAYAKQENQELKELITPIIYAVKYAKQE